MGSWGVRSWTLSESTTRVEERRGRRAPDETSGEVGFEGDAQGPSPAVRHATGRWGRRLSVLSVSVRSSLPREEAT